MGEKRVHDSDQPWAAGMLDDLLAAWSQHADTPSGLFNPWLDRQWRHHTDGPRTLVSQCRLIYNFARGHQRNGDPRYADLTHRGIDALIRYFRDPAEGSAAGEAGWAWSCDAAGAVADDTHDAYGHAFVILALATAAAVDHRDDYRDLALQTWAFMQRRFLDQHGGLVWHIGRDGAIQDSVRSQNPMMHTFEALLELAPQDPSGVVAGDARRVWDFLQARMPGPGRLPEWYDPDWRALHTGDLAIIDVGHAFEWAFLLSEAAALFGDDSLLTPGREFLAFGLRSGYDAGSGGIFSPVDDAGNWPGRRKGWWEQCEAIRALRRYVARHGASEAAAPLDATIAFVQRHYVDAEFGGWYLNPPGMGGEPSLDKGNPYKLDYHVLNMCRELLAS